MNYLAFPKLLIYLLVIVMLGNAYGVVQEFGESDYVAALTSIAGIFLPLSMAILLNGLTIVQGKIGGTISDKSLYLSFSFLAVSILAYLNGMYLEYFTL